jgi:hypothetical protein
MGTTFSMMAQDYQKYKFLLKMELTSKHKNPPLLNRVEEGIWGFRNGPQIGYLC